jgi:hypothetical protein
MVQLVEVDGDIIGCNLGGDAGEQSPEGTGSGEAQPQSVGERRVNRFDRLPEAVELAIGLDALLLWQAFVLGLDDHVRTVFPPPVLVPPLAREAPISKIVSVSLAPCAEVSKT